MSSSKKYPQELRERAVRMFAESKGDHESELAAMKAVATTTWTRSPAATTLQITTSFERRGPASGTLSRSEGRDGQLLVNASTHLCDRSKKQLT
ncbi:hypothetical protein [Nocardia sp. NPDC005366]|uniref:hypothetical protein n=1 Tax=Nocardia sp. NPDC005366 TaxID=3156878 RepID=UPI0033BBAFB5